MSGGTLPRITVSAPASLEEGQQVLYIPQQVATYLSQRGLSPMGPPQGNRSYNGILPDVTNLTDDQLGQLLNEVARMAEYVEEEVVTAEISMLAAEQDMEFIEARLRMSIGSKDENDGHKITIQEKNDLVKTNPKFIESRDRFLFYQALYKFTKTRAAVEQRNWDTISRRITQRGQDVDRQRREGNVGNVPTAARTFQRPGMRNQ